MHWTVIRPIKLLPFVYTENHFFGGKRFCFEKHRTSPTSSAERTNIAPLESATSTFYFSRAQFNLERDFVSKHFPFNTRLRHALQNYKCFHSFQFYQTVRLVSCVFVSHQLKNRFFSVNNFRWKICTMKLQHRTAQNREISENCKRKFRLLSGREFSNFRWSLLFFGNAI